jgi:mRNA interferase MazF
MQEGDVIRYALHQQDEEIVKRPALIIKKIPPYNDFLICGISSSIGLAVKGFDVVVTEKDLDFATWGLKFPGVIRIGFLFTVPSKLIEGSIGNITKETHRALLNNLSNFLKT